MGGGLFGTPLTLNTKCVIFSTFIMVIYYLPRPHSMAHHFIMSVLMTISAYVLLAWYDVIYDCNDRLKPTYLGWLSKNIKPPEYRTQYSQLPIKTQKTIRNFDILVLVILLITFIYPFVFRFKK